MRRLPSKPPLLPHKNPDIHANPRGARRIPGRLLGIHRKALGHRPIRPFLLQMGSPEWRSDARPHLESRAFQGLGLRPVLSQPSGRSLSRQCDFPPPGFVATVTVHKTRLPVLPLEKSILI